MMKSYALWENIKRNGPAIADTLALNVEDESGEIHFIASGQELARRELAAEQIAG